MNDNDNLQMTPPAPPNEAPQYAAPEAGQQAGYQQQPYGYPYGYQQPQDQSNGYYPHTYAPAPPREPNPLAALTLGIVAAVLILIGSSISGLFTAVSRSDYATVILTVIFFIVMLVQLALAVVAMVSGRRAMKMKPCGRSSVAYIFGLVDTCLGGSVTLLFLFGLIIGGVM